MKVFVINLDQDSDRLEVVRRQFERIGVAFERLPAVYGKSLSCQAKRHALSRFRWWCAVGRPTTDGELGCALSHAAFYRKVVDEDLPIACVVEDDVVLDDRFKLVLDALEKQCVRDAPQVVLLSNHSDKDGQLGDGYNGFVTPSVVREVSLKRIMGDMFTEGYVVTNGGARAMLKANAPIAVPCDWWHRWAGLGKIELYHAFPTVCRQDKAAFESHTVVGMVKPTKDLSLPLYCLHMIKRAVGLAIDRVLIRVLGR